MSRANKFNAMPVVIDEIRFASKREAARYSDLKMLQRAGVIEDLTVQVPFDCRINGHKICTYKADFAYTQTETGQRVIEDSKGYPTPVYRLKKKLVEALHNILIVEV